MAILSLQSITADGVEPSYAAVTSQDVISGGGSDRVFLSVVNDGGSSVTVSVDAVRTSVSVPGVGQMIVPDMSVDVPAGESRMIGPFRDAYVSSAGEITLDFSGTSSVTAAALILERGV